MQTPMLQSNNADGNQKPKFCEQTGQVAILQSVNLKVGIREAQTSSFKRVCGNKAPKRQAQSFDSALLDKMLHVRYKQWRTRYAKVTV